jgi:hypothetical protein
MLPHPDIRKSQRLDESIFAADLGQVVRGEAAYDWWLPWLTTEVHHQRIC